jgi:CheY-like chemotaxis protein
MSSAGERGVDLSSVSTDEAARVRALQAAFQDAVAALRYRVVQASEGFPLDPDLAGEAGPALHRLAWLLAGGRSDAPAPHRSADPEILIADDDESCRLVIDSILFALSVMNPRVQLRDGDEIVAHLEGGLAAKAAVPALVILDGSMPGRSGFEVLRWMRSTPALSSVPVVMLTGTSDVASIREAYEQGAASYLVKPVAFDALAEVIRGLDRPWLLL